jgi:hypothetical protein
MDGKTSWWQTGTCIPLSIVINGAPVTRNNLSCFATFEMESLQESVLRPEAGWPKRGVRVEWHQRILI